VGQQEFLAQLAQFSTVEGLENLNSQFSDLLQLQLLNNGAELLGRTVTHGEGQTGVVEAISQSGSQVLVRVGDHLVPLSDVQTITDTQAATQTAEAAATDSTTTETATTTDPIETFFRLGRERE
jgi:flagellar basal-body rod modification protein FlgD